MRTIGALVWHKKLAEVGEVIMTSLEKVCIKWDDGKEVDYDIHMCINAGKIIPL